MEAHAMTHRGSPHARRGATLDAVAGYQYLSPQRVWMDEARETALAEAAQRRLLVGTGHVSVPRSPGAAVRHRLGAVLVNLGSRLQGASAEGQTVAASAGSGVGV